MNNKRSKHWVPFAIFSVVLPLLVINMQACINLPSPPCTYDILHSDQMFTCDFYRQLDPVRPGTADTYKAHRAEFLQQWPQMGYSQEHSPVFDVSANAPEFIGSTGVFWAAPLTG